MRYKSGKKKQTHRPKTDFRTLSPPDVSHSPPTHTQQHPPPDSHSHSHLQIRDTLAPPRWPSRPRSCTPRPHKHPLLSSRPSLTLLLADFSRPPSSPFRSPGHDLPTATHAKFPRPPNFTRTQQAPHRPPPPEKPPAAPAPVTAPGTRAARHSQALRPGGQVPGQRRQPAPAAVQRVPGASAGGGAGRPARGPGGLRPEQQQQQPGEQARPAARGSERSPDPLRHLVWSADSGAGLRGRDGSALALGSATVHGHRRKFSPRRLRAQRAPGARAARQRPEGSANPAPIRADAPVLAANPTGPGQGRSADAPVLSPRCQPAPGSRARQVPPPLRGRRSAAQPGLCARGHLPRGSGARSDPGRTRSSPCSPPGAGAPRCPGLRTERAVRDNARLLRAALREPRRPPAEQSAARRSPPAGSAPLVPRPRPGRSPPHTRAPRPAASGRPTLGALPRRPATPRLLLIGCRSPRRPARAAIGAFATVPPLPPRAAPPHFLFPPEV